MNTLKRELGYVLSKRLLTIVVVIFVSFSENSLAQSADATKMLEQIYPDTYAMIQNHWFPEMEPTADGLRAKLSKVEKVPGTFGVLQSLIFHNGEKLIRSETMVNGQATDISLYEMTLQNEINTKYYVVIANYTHVEFHKTYVFRHILKSGTDEIIIRELVAAGVSFTTEAEVKTINLLSKQDALYKGSLMAVNSNAYFSIQINGGWKSVIAIGCDCQYQNGIGRGAIINIVSLDAEPWRYKRLKQG